MNNSTIEMSAGVVFKQAAGLHERLSNHRKRMHDAAIEKGFYQWLEEKTPKWYSGFTAKGRWIAKRHHLLSAGCELGHSREALQSWWDNEGKELALYWWSTQHYGLYHFETPGDYEKRALELKKATSGLSSKTKVFLTVEDYNLLFSA